MSEHLFVSQKNGCVLMRCQVVVTYFPHKVTYEGKLRSIARPHACNVYLHFSLYVWLASYDLVQRRMQFRRGDFFAGTLQCACLSRMCDSGIRRHIFGHASFLLNSEAKLKCCADLREITQANHDFVINM